MSKEEHANRNISKLIKLVKSRLSSAGKAKSTDANGNIKYVDCDIFSNDTLADFLTLSLSDFNQAPYFTFFTFDNADFVTTFAEVLVEGAVLQALAAHSLVERGREFQMTDNGLTFQPPSISELMNTQYCTLLNHHFEKVRRIKIESSLTKEFGKKKK